ncbi:hypothetical protein SLEP1_g6460 [Rubroshorea leprosula]|uniref:Uncharacterized protein n=1 Tax=Rubroshorea leprosula TaxID=152421 RepID=A0AAV5HVL3_9ROSI|nr:hypothetical protein SLEP1_g6460 [Rubroshorea leprosula]
MRVSTTTNKERGKIPVNPLEVKTLGTLTENLLRVASTHEISPGNEMVQVYEYSKIIPRANLLSEFEDYLLRSTRENVMKGIKQDGRQMEIGESSNSATRISEKIVRTIEESQENIFTSAQSQEIRRTGIRRQNGANPFDVPQRSTRKRQREASNNVEQRNVLIDFGPPIYICTKCGAWHWIQEKIKKDRSNGIIHFSLCCKDGKL